MLKKNKNMYQTVLKTPGTKIWKRAFLKAMCYWHKDRLTKALKKVRPGYWYFLKAPKMF